MKYKILSIVFISLLVFLNSCVTPKDTNLLQNIQKDYPMVQNITSTDYRIIPGDQLALNIYTLDEDMKDLFSMYIGKKNSNSNSTINNNQRSESINNNQGNTNLNILNVYSDGTINIPYLGKIYVEDLTILEAKRLIETRFKEFSPNLSIELNLNNRYFSVLGEASRGMYLMPTTEITIFQALAISGPIKTFGDRTKVRIIRQTPNGTEVKMFDLRSQDIVNSEYYYIQPNDVIYVQQMSRTFFGRYTSFTGVLSTFGIITSLIASAVLISNSIK